MMFKELGKKFIKDDIGVTAENKKKQMRFNVKMNVKLTVVTDKVCEEASQDIQLRFIDN